MYGPYSRAANLDTTIRKRLQWRTTVAAGPAVSCTLLTLSSAIPYTLPALGLQLPMTQQTHHLSAHAVCCLQALVPPTALPMVEGWLQELGTMPKPRPKGQWAPAQKPLPESLEAAVRTPAQPAAATSGSRGCGGGRMCWPASVLVVLSAAAAVAFAV